MPKVWVQSIQAKQQDSSSPFTCHLDQGCSGYMEPVTFLSYCKVTCLTFTILLAEKKNIQMKELFVET